MTFLEALLRRAYDAFNQRDIQIVLDCMHPDVVWANGQHGGVLTGRDAVRAYWTQQWKEIDPSVEPDAFASAPGGRVAVTVHQVVHDLSGSLLSDQIVRHVYSFKDNLINKMEIE